ncbi:MAG: hypothetical protein K0Q59_2994 [Paenibacillus sp.]|jgi:hypothetical protein|nr:hypothetical protein [Paenibacillus sp.]
MRIGVGSTMDKLVTEIMREIDQYWVRRGSCLPQ